MLKSINDIDAQFNRVLVLAEETGHFNGNARGVPNTYLLAQIRRQTLVQHGFGMFDTDRDVKHPAKIRAAAPIEQPKEEPEPEPVKEVEQTPTEVAHNRMAFEDWMNADEANRRLIQDACRHAFINKMYAELLGDMEICKLEGWDVMEYPRMMRDAIMRIFPKEPVQLTLF